MEDSPIPLPVESDFCAGGSGMVKESLKHTTYDGTFQVQPFTLSAQQTNSMTIGLKYAQYKLNLLTTGGSGVGFGNPGGVIHQLDCGSGSLTLVQLDPQGMSPLFKFYGARSVGEPRWYN